ncbi:hypothetical protein NQ176_g10268 [Zarea fungicola]|uniref:Uncharacterized protein n=1 Tax=Zarea fungicola TaxID=93591 RepID=A0ACC1MGW4_9HYPO|nr:hypothetical protein NQ176_g10268 [Lecanicillium fungicola]
MRLINVSSLDIEEFHGHQIPKYAILSHTWGEEEVTLQDWNRRHEFPLFSKSGYRKITSACQLASASNYTHIWVDTNCIDKTSSAELSEAINSMFAWYRDAQICYAYLDDVTVRPEYPSSLLFKSARWFTRGWTLQELLAPVDVLFYDRDWTYIKSRKSAAGALSAATSIPISVLLRRDNVFTASAAQRMSWLAKRQTTRLEDMAYCMFGIFNVNIPLLYGEGDKAFARLQEEIIRSFHDHTIFCWSWPPSLARPNWIPTLAPCAAAFADSGDCIRRPRASNARLPARYDVNHMGVSMQLPLIRTSSPTCLALLDAQIEGMPRTTCLAIALMCEEEAPTWEDKMLWRCPDPNGPISVKAEWGGIISQLHLVKSNLHPLDPGFTLHRVPWHKLAHWPDVTASKYAVVPMERGQVDSGCRRCYAQQGLTRKFCCLKPTAEPTVWSYTLYVQYPHTYSDRIKFTVVVHETDDAVNWSVTREPVPVADIEQWALGLSLDTYHEPCPWPVGEGGDVNLEIMPGLELGELALGSLKGMTVMPLFINHDKPRHTEEENLKIALEGS